METRKQIARLRRQILYFAGVATRSESRQQIRQAHQAIVQRERQLQALSQLQRSA